MISWAGAGTYTSTGTGAGTAIATASHGLYSVGPDQPVANADMRRRWELPSKVA